ncbi:MAG: type II secretion system F family protein [Vampirovibrio sp.]|nr:type II secretion system F family protein [Vampirovibrio sp.]
MEVMLLIFCLLGTLALFAVGLMSNRENQQVQERLSQISNTPESATQMLRKKSMEKSFKDRVLFPVAQNFFDRVQAFIPMGSKSWVSAKLVQAGYTKTHYPQVFLGIQLLTTLILFGGFFTISLLFGKLDGMLGIAIPIVFGLMGLLLPMLWLSQQAKKRQDSIQKSLPDFLDLLVICVEAGLGLDVAINKLANLKTSKTSSYLREELNLYTKDVAFGKARKQALLDMATRTGVEDFATIINALVQSYEMGSSVAHTLRVQSETLRTKRMQKAEEKANKISVKMVLPIYIFLFPSIFVSILGPIAMIVVKAVSEILGSMAQ